ncbi:MAG: YggT family protein [Bacteriovoracaceae bacterium]
MRYLIQLYLWLIIADSILTYFPQFRRQSWAQKIKQAADFTLSPVRKILPQDLPFDFSPIIVLMGLNLLMLIF